jgi:Holliday junction resolvasome RuvABC endonuclease subunit
MSVAASTVKKYATGSGRAEKPDMIHAAKQKFVDLDVDDDNAADAVHILCYGMSAKYQLESF